jgi:hypothetical protein
MAQQQNPFGSELQALGAVLIALEPLSPEQRQFVLATATTRLGITNSSGVSNPGGSASSNSGGVSAAIDSEITSKEFIKLKKPNSETQRAVCLAYYLTHHRNQPHFKTRDLTALNTDAACPKLSNPARTVDNATKQNGLFAPAGKGSKQITPYGEDVVKALPDQDAVVALRRDATPLKKKRTTKRASKRA